MFVSEVWALAIFGVIVSGLIGFGVWVVRNMSALGSRTAVLETEVEAIKERQADHYAISRDTHGAVNDLTVAIAEIKISLKH